MSDDVRAAVDALLDAIAEHVPLGKQSHYRSAVQVLTDRLVAVERERANWKDEALEYNRQLCEEIALRRDRDRALAAIKAKAVLHSSVLALQIVEICDAISAGHADTDTHTAPSGDGTS